MAGEIVRLPGIQPIPDVVMLADAGFSEHEEPVFEEGALEAMGLHLQESESATVLQTHLLPSRVLAVVGVLPPRPKSRLDALIHPPDPAVVHANKELVALSVSAKRLEIPYENFTNPEDTLDWVGRVLHKKLISTSTGPKDRQSVSAGVVPIVQAHAVDLKESQA